jgi:hypothetical protein
MVLTKSCSSCLAGCLSARTGKVKESHYVSEFINGRGKFSVGHASGEVSGLILRLSDGIMARLGILMKVFLTTMELSIQISS